MNSKDIDFSEITKDDILQAFKKYDNLLEHHLLNINRKQKDYILFYNSKEYPHKYIVGIAYGLKYNQEILDNSLYNSTGNHKRSADWCLKNNGFELYADRKYKKYLEANYTNRTTINTYYSDLKKAIKIFQNIPNLKDIDLNKIFEVMSNKSITFEMYDKSQKELGFNDNQLFSTLKTKAKIYKEALNFKGKEDMQEEKFKKYLENVKNKNGNNFNNKKINKLVDILKNKFIYKLKYLNENINFNSLFDTNDIMYLENLKNRCKKIII